MSKTKLGTAEAIMIILTVIVARSILSLPTDILNGFKSATILNLIYVSIIAILIVLLICKLFKKFPGLDIIDICEITGGKVFKNIIGSIFIIYFLVSAGLMTRNFCESIKILYYPMTNVFFIIALFVIAICTVNRLNFGATAKTTLIIIPIALISILFLFFTNINKFVPERIFPILGNGFFNTFILGTTNIASFGGIAYLYFLPPMLKEPKNFKKIALISIVLTAIFLIFTVAILLFIFTFFVHVDEISPLYTATRYIEFGNFFQRLESLFLLIWILIFACYISIACRFSMNIFQKLTNIETTKPLANIFGLLVLAISLIPKNLAIVQDFGSKIYPYLMIALVLIISISILIFANIIKRKKQLNVRKESS